MRIVIALMLALSVAFNTRIDVNEQRLKSELENYVIDVIDEGDWWETCDSTAFSMYEPESLEWYFAVVTEYDKDMMEGN